MSMSIQRKIFLGIKLVRIVALLLTSRFCVAAAPDVVSIWGGARGTIILKSDGTVWTWGSNIGGKLGVNALPATLGRVLHPSGGAWAGRRGLPAFDHSHHGRRGA